MPETKRTTETPCPYCGTGTLTRESIKTGHGAAVQWVRGREYCSNTTCTGPER